MWYEYHSEWHEIIIVSFLRTLTHLCLIIIYVCVVVCCLSVWVGWPFSVRWSVLVSTMSLSLRLSSLTSKPSTAGKLLLCMSRTILTLFHILYILDDRNINTIFIKSNILLFYICRKIILMRNRHFQNIIFKFWIFATIRYCANIWLFSLLFRFFIMIILFDTPWSNSHFSEYDFCCLLTYHPIDILQFPSLSHISL